LESEIPEFDKPLLPEENKMGIALGLSFLAIAFYFLLVFFFGLDDGKSFGKIDSSWNNCSSQNDRGFNFSFPSSCTVVNSTSKDNGVITLIPPNNYDLFRDKMTFGMEKLQSNMSLHEYSNQALKILSKSLQEFHLIDSNPYVLSATVWERIVFTHETDNRIIKVLQFWTIKDDYVYIISFGTTPDSYFSYIPTIYNIISGVEIFTNNTVDIPSSIIKESIYKSPEGFVLKYPSNWNKVLGQNRVSFIAEQDNPQDHYLERVDFYYHRGDDNSLGTTYGENDFLKVDLINEIRYLANNLQNLKLISVNDMNFSKISGKELLYTYNSNLSATKSKEIMIRNNTYLFEIIFTTQKDEFDKFSPIINRIIDSVRLSNVKLE
jgi:hypothetical protein